MLATVISVLATAGGAPAARAISIVPCPSGPGVTIGFTYLQYPPGFYTTIGTWSFSQFVINSSTPDFLVAQQEVVANNTSTTITGTFTSSVAQTFSLSTVFGDSQSIMNMLTESVSTSIVASLTTTIGVSATAPVPPFSSVTGQYGVRAYDINYTINTYSSPGVVNSVPTECIPGSTQQGTGVAPTSLTGWQVIPGG